MRQMISLPISLKEPSPTEVIVTIRINQESLTSWCLELMLLEKGMIQHLRVTDDTYSTQLELQIDPSIHQTRRGKFTKSAKGFSLVVTPIELELWSSFFLKYYCNGVADVDHLDVELRSETSSELLLILKAEDFLGAVNEEEARHLLNL